MENKNVLDLIDAWVEGRVVPEVELPLIAGRAIDLMNREAAKEADRE
jgi:hypothetical protein